MSQRLETDEDIDRDCDDDLNETNGRVYQKLVTPSEIDASDQEGPKHIPTPSEMDLNSSNLNISKLKTPTNMDRSTSQK